ncbi:MAG: sel1 repeat family protein [Proteobacteria bacterium]|nr:sel1 repeat family protein [Pseudomonadota bacterium]
MCHSYKLFLASLVSSLVAPLPLLGMEPEENECVSTPVAASTPVQKENWKDSLYEFPEIQAGFKMDVFNRLLFTPEFKDPTKQNALFQCLEQAAFERRNPKALEKVKQFSTKPFLHINRVDPEKVKKADKCLRNYFDQQKAAESERLSIEKFIYQIGYAYQEGLGVKQDLDLAGQYLLTALEFLTDLEWDPKASTLLHLGVLFYEGAPSIPQNITIAQLLWERAEARGNTSASCNLAALYYTAKNYSKAVEYFKKDSENGDLLSTLNLAALYFNGENGLEKDHGQALEYFLRVFNSKEIDTKEKNKCAAHIGTIYYNGFPGTLPDHRKALHFFMKADIKDPDIQDKIAQCYERLNDRKKVFQWCLKSAQRGDPKALSVVGYDYATGVVTKRNIAQAKKSFKRAVGVLKSRTELKEEEDIILQKCLFNYGNLMKKTDRNTAVTYILQAAERGFSCAMVDIAHYYLSMQTPAALGKAFFWIKKAQELNDPKAQILFDAATQRAQESEETSQDDKNLVECMKSLDQPEVVNSLASYSLSTAPLQESPPSPDASGEEEMKSTTVGDYAITPEEIECWKVEEAKWKDDIKNPKFIREKLQQAHQNFQNKQEIKERPPLSSTSAKTIETLRDKGSRSQITIDNLFSLFEDPYFQGQIDMFKTADGYAIVGYDFSTGAAKSTGTHRKHNKSYKGLDHNFLKSVAELVEEFMTPPGVQG